jgi:protein FrlC
MPFKYSFNTWCYSSFPVWVPSYSLEEAARRIRAAGYDGIEIGCAAPHAWPAHLSSNRRSELKGLFHDLGLTVSSLLPAPGGGPGNNPSSLLPEERASTIAHYKDVVDLAADLGSTRVLYIAGWRSFGVSREDAYSWSLEALVAIAKHAVERGVTICIEPTSADSNLIDTASDALRLREQAALENVKVMFDTYHALYRNEVSSDYVHEMAPHLAHVHFADIDRLPPGEGVVDWVGVMQSLKDTRFEGFLTMEIGFAARRVEPDRYVRSAITYLKSIEEKLR